MVAETIAAIAFKGLACALPSLAVAPACERLMERKRTAYKEWFSQGMRAWASGESASERNRSLASEWHGALGALVADKAISVEDAAAARRVGALEDDAEGLPTTEEQDARFRLRKSSATRASRAFFASAFAVGCVLALGHPSLAQIAIVGAICALAFGAALVDVRCKVIPDELVAALYLAGIALCLTQDVRSPILFSGLMTALAITAYLAVHAVDAIFAAFHSGTHAIGAGDQKILGAIVLCACGTGLLPAAVACLAGLAGTAILSRPDNAIRKSRIVFGPAAAAALITGAVASITM